jgi:hypothetical protein
MPALYLRYPFAHTTCITRPLYAQEHPLCCLIHCSKSDTLCHRPCARMYFTGKIITCPNAQALAAI